MPKFKRKKVYNYQNSVVIIYADRVGVRDVWDAHKLKKKWGLQEIILLTGMPISPNVEKQAILKDVQIKISKKPKEEARSLKQDFQCKGVPCYIKCIEDITERNFTMDPM